MKRVILLLETSRAFGRQLISGVARYSRLNTTWTFFKEPIDLKSSIPNLTKWKPDGIIMRDTLITKEMLKLKVPTIFAPHFINYPKNIPIIITDSSSTARMASRHFIEKGFKNLAYCGFDGIVWSEEREFYFDRFNSECGIKTHHYIPLKRNIPGGWEKEQQHICKWIKKLPKPVGILACNDDRGQHILEVCKLTNIKVPEEAAVLGVDNDEIVCEFADPPLSSIALNVETAGFEAAKLLDKMMSTGKKINSRQIVAMPSHIVQRQSSDILAVDDQEVARAIQYIKNNAKNKIMVKDVVDATSSGRRALEKKFNETIHRTIYNEIQQVRVELISKLLIETNMPVSQITSLFNFTDVEHISRFFKKEKGIGLREFRKIHKPH
ncbi:MAG: DNA-binding transcriptional regulator [Bacteroidetes bacterium]|nr:DNA-binding transcriptional regulator [Bacteroidota bacterium]